MVSSITVQSYTSEVSNFQSHSEGAGGMAMESWKQIAIAIGISSVVGEAHIRVQRLHPPSRRLVQPTVSFHGTPQLQEFHHPYGGSSIFSLGRVAQWLKLLCLPI